MMSEIEALTWAGLEVTDRPQKVIAQPTNKWFIMCQGREILQDVVESSD